MQICRAQTTASTSCNAAKSHLELRKGDGKGQTRGWAAPHPLPTAKAMQLQYAGVAPCSCVSAGRLQPSEALQCSYTKTLFELRLARLQMVYSPLLSARSWKMH